MAERNGTRSAQAFLALGEDGVVGVGLSRTKYAYIRTAAQAIASGNLDLATVASLPAKQAIETLTQHKGIGPWTAEIYLMFCAGHPDIFPVGDLALRKAATEALNREDPFKAAEPLVSLSFYCCFFVVAILFQHSPPSRPASLISAALPFWCVALVKRAGFINLNRSNQDPRIRPLVAVTLPEAYRCYSTSILLVVNYTF